MLLVTLFSVDLLSQTVEVVSEDYTLYGAKKSALESLSSMIKSEVKAEFYQSITEKNGDIDKQIRTSLNIISDLPMIGVKYEVIKQEPQEDAPPLKTLKVRASINSTVSLPLYLNSITKDTKSVNALYKKDISLYTLEEKRAHYKKSLTLLAKIEKYKVVAFFLGSREFAPLLTNRDEIDFELSELNTKANNLHEAVELFVEAFEIKNKSTYIDFARYKNSLTATVFAKELQSNMQEFSSSNSSTYKQYKLKGKYKILQSGHIYIRYKLYNKNNKFIKEKSVQMKNTKYSQNDLIPKLYCLELKHSPECFGAEGWKNKLERTLKSLNINYSPSCENANKFSIYLKHKKFYSEQLGNNVHYFSFDMKLKNKKNRVMAHEKRDYTYADQEQEDFNYELSEVESIDTNLQNKLINMINRTN